MKKITIIGANSSIARNFIYFLKDKKIDVVLYDIQEKFIDSDNYDYKQLDLLDINKVNKIDCLGDAIFIFSGLTGAENSVNFANRYIDVNEKTFINILDTVKTKNPDCQIIYPSSRLVYKDLPGELSEDSELEPKSIYSANKIFCENCLKIYNRMFGINFTVFRIAIPFGKMNPDADSFGIVSKLLQQGKNGKISLFGDGEGVRTFTHIKDICNVLYNSIGCKQMQNEIFNIGGKVYSFIDLANVISSKFKCDIEFKPWPESTMKVEVFNGNLNSQKLDSILNLNYSDIKEELY